MTIYMTIDALGYGELVTYFFQPQCCWRVLSNAGIYEFSLSTHEIDSDSAEDECEPVLRKPDFLHFLVDLRQSHILILWYVTLLRETGFDESEDGQGCQRKYGRQSEEIARKCVQRTS